LARGPLIRARLLRLDEQEHVLLVTQHHIVSDGWSVGVLVRELTALYSAFSQALEDPLAPLAIQYADYALWQRDYLQGEALERQRGFWSAHLAGAPALLELPTDHPRPARQSHAGASVAFTLPAALTAQLQALGQRHGATLFMVLLGAWSVLMSRLSGQDDVVIGTPVANRQRAEVEPLIGFFVNTLAVRVRLDADPSVAQLLEQVKHTMLDAYAHQDIPFEQVVETLNPTRNLSHSPLFQVMLTLNNTPPGAASALPGLRLAQLEQPGTVTQFDLSLSLVEVEGGLEGGLTFASDLFELSSIERLLACWTNLLRAMAVMENAECQVHRLPLLDGAQTRRLLVDFNDTMTLPRPGRLLHQLFEEQAALHPDASALAFDGTHCSYGELNRRANQIAHRLIGMGVRSDCRVAVCMDRSLDLVAALLGILKAGGAYVALDPAYPAERLAYLLADSGALALLTTRAHLHRLPDSSAPICLDSADLLLCLAGSLGNPDLPSADSDAAYVIYTSGSTGQPKGVVVEHRNVVNLVAHHVGLCELTAADRVLQFASFGFDNSVAEVFPALSVGACVVLRAAHLMVPDAAFGAFLEAERISVTDLPTSFWHLWADEVQQQRCLPGAALRVVLAGGEKAELRRLRSWFNAPATASARWINTYGPSEATVNAATVGYRHDSALPAYEIPLGRPLDNTTIYVLDRHLQPVPLGVSGEIHIGGAGVARGYLNRPELTAERFVADPFSSAPDARMYKTGDLGRWRADGQLEYLGRNDFQVKLRGFRIELGEIEARLVACAGVREAVVLALAPAQGEGDARLVAYLTATPEGDAAALEPGALRQALLAHLPEYMVPGAFVTLAALPLTPNGKLDRKALPAPDGAALALARYAAPQGATEQALAAIWQELLGVERVGREDHFFDLGGHSLLAVQLASRVRQRMGAELPLRTLFARPLLRELAGSLAQLACAPLAPIAAASRAAPLPLSFAQQRLWFLDQLDHAAAAAYHMPAGLRLSGELDTDALVRALDRIVARHESLRTCFVEVDGMPWQRIGAAGQGMALARHDLSHLRGHEQEQALAAQAQDESAAPFDLARGPLIRARLLRLGEREHVLLVTQHHIVSDGWSVGVLVREFAALYTAFNQALDDPLAPLAIQYADYAAWQRSDEQGKLLARQSGFWSAHLAGAPALLELPTDHPRPARQSHAGASVAFTLPAALTAQLQALGQRHGATLFMVLLGAWSVLMSRLSGQDDVVTGTPVANRQRAEVEPLIGFFVNTLAVRVRLDADPSVAQLLEQVKHTMLDAYAHQDIPFEQVVEAVKPVRSTSHSPLFQTLLTLDNTPDSGPLALPGLTLSGLAMPANLTKFDLTLSLVEQGGQLAGALDFACELFERSSVERLLSYWQVLLASMTAHVERPVSQLPLLDAAQQQAVLARSTAPSAVFPADRLLHQLFEDQAAAQPDALAVVCAGHTLSYAQLNHQANRLAHYLRDLGVGPDALVALYLERGVPMVVGILAVLKAGGAYLPLDPGAPQERSASIVADAGAAVVLTERALVGQAPQVEAVLCLDDDRRWRDLPVQAPVCGATPTSLAYVIYTSGSTGRPKGVMVEHRAVLNLWTALAAAVFDDVRPSRVALNAGIWFDASVKGLVQLLSGHSLHIIPQDVRADGRALLAFLERERIDAFDCTPAQLDQLLDAGLLDATRRPARCLVGGEAIKPASWRRLQADTRTAFYNVYGPTECTVDATVALINGPATPPHLGTPIGNTQLYLLDRHLQLVPPGVSGEIHIGGAGVARGYLNRPELTAERFVADPFSSAPDARMYKTGDLGRWRADGQLEYLGRNDFQVKLRGFRIELGEIEARLVACAGVREAVVLALAQGEGEARLVAYLTATPESDPAAFEPGALRQALLAHLPEYMVPGAFVTLAALPLTPNGKLDRKALP
ncbi:non-ribosomal peptide synthetase, partial [Massilia rubra]